MSEYWKSTPKYWCKHCKVFVRDTKLERQNHDATPRHQSNLKRFLRDLHRGHEKEEKDRDRAKSEVARLNGLISGTGHSESSSSSGFGHGPMPSVPKLQATPSQRKQQLAQLAEMGVSIPDEFRGEMAMVGEWQVTSERIIDTGGGKEKKPEAIGFGVRKRAMPDEEEEVEVMETKKRRWGSTYRTHPAEDDDDLDALLKKPTGKVNKGPDVKKEPVEAASDNTNPLPKVENPIGEDQKPSIKSEPSDGEITFSDGPNPPSDASVKRAEESEVGNVVFKKRKAKTICQK